MNRAHSTRPFLLLASAALAALLAAPPLGAQAGLSVDALPLQKGNTWTYDGTIWWVPHNTRRVLEERVSLEMEVLEVVQWGRMRGAILRGYPQDLVTPLADRHRGEFTLLQVGSQVHLLRGEEGAEAMRRLKERDETVAELARGAEVILDLPLAPGKTFCPERTERTAPRRCWSVKDETPVSMLPVYGLSTKRAFHRYVLDLRSRGEHEVRGFAPGVGFTSFAIGHAGDPSALELELVAVRLAPPRGIFLKTLDLSDEPPVMLASGQSVAAGPAVPSSEALAAEEPAEGPAPPPVQAPVPPPAETPAPPPAEEPAPPPDSDGDGVPDEADRCQGSAAGEVVDRTGCPLPPPDRIVQRRAHPRALAMEVAPEVIPVPEYNRPACLDEREWFLSGEPIEFDGRSFDPIGTPEPISLDNLVEVGQYDDVPLYAGRYAQPPHMDVWVPVCGSPDTFRLYADLGSRN